MLPRQQSGTMVILLLRLRRELCVDKFEDLGLLTVGKRSVKLYFNYSNSHHSAE